MDFKNEVEQFLAAKQPVQPEEMVALLKKVYLAGAKAVFRDQPTPDNGWLHFQPKVAMLVTSRDEEEQQEQLIVALKRMLAI